MARPRGGAADGRSHFGALATAESETVVVARNVTELRHAALAGGVCHSPLASLVDGGRSGTLARVPGAEPKAKEVGWR